MSQQRNPRYWTSPWYTTKYAEKPWPAGWYWHDEGYNWTGPYNTEQVARQDLDLYEYNRQIPIAGTLLHS
jgi:hypothetical protein